MNNCYRDLLALNFKDFKKLAYNYGVDIDQEQLLLIYNLIQNNRYALLDSHYNEVLYNFISEKTSISTCLKIKNFINNCPAYFKLGLNV
ncbi:hypothetical protein [Thomasclavelia sp.]|uniref:hypothetical protein n=1 Tax=Thomasclavelia sp. TaxID=3025757 RepID=UPI0025EFBA08|nr:hypothetical protein [Thomasclavelia sp.]